MVIVATLSHGGALAWLLAAALHHGHVSSSLLIESSGEECCSGLPPGEHLRRPGYLVRPRSTDTSILRQASPA